MNMIKKILYSIFALSFLASCAIENDIPYPQIVGSITAFEVEGQRGPEDNEGSTAAVIDANARTVTVYVNDSVDVRELKITRLALDPRDAALVMDSALCDDAEHFPFEHFASLDSIPVSSNTRVDFSKPVNMTVRTYQDYVWKVTVEQIIKRDIDVDGMTRKVIDPDTHAVIIYVNKDKVPDLSQVQIITLNLGGEYGTVKPDPTTVHDFSKGGQEFNVHLNWEAPGLNTTWTVHVYQDTESSSSSSNAETFAMVSSATVSGSCTRGSSVEVEYREQNSTRAAEGWQSVQATVTGTTYTAKLTGLKGSTTYVYRPVIDGTAGAEKTFTTAGEQQLENGSFEQWSNDGDIAIPNAAGGTFWGTGNPGAASFIGNLTTQTNDAVSGTAARLESKWAVIKLGAGNLFTGDFSLDGTHGKLNFGRPFTSFPTALRLYYKYTPATIDRIGDDSLESLRGKSDTCHIYVALSDKPEPYVIRTRPSERQLFNKNDANIIAYGEFLSAATQSSYKQITIPLDYRATNRTPKYIVIVCAASKYGDYYTGGAGSTLFIDEMELVYE